MKKLLLLLIIIMFQSCKDEYDLTPIDNIKIGISAYNYQGRIDSINVFSQKCIPTIVPFIQSESIIKSICNVHMTNFFNINLLNERFIQYPSVLHVTTNENVNITSLTILLGHLAPLTGINKGSIFTLPEKELPAYVQVVSEDYLDYLINYMNKEYGNYSDVPDLNLKETFYYEIDAENKRIQRIPQFLPIKGKRYFWETKTYIIELYSGIPIDYYVSEVDNPYSYKLLTEGNEVDENEINCYKYGYINFKLKENVIKELRL